MLIAFEGPDNTGKTFAANKLSGDNAIYNVHGATYKEAQALVASDKGLVQCFDRISWFTHLVYKTAMPNHVWPETQVHAVFMMPDTHLVFKLYRRGHEPIDDSEEGYEVGAPAIVNQVYTSLAHSFMALNEDRSYELFKSVTIMEVYTGPTGERQQEVVEFSSPLHSIWETNRTALIHDDLSLLDMLLVEEASR